MVRPRRLLRCRTKGWHDVAVCLGEAGGGGGGGGGSVFVSSYRRQLRFGGGMNRRPSRERVLSDRGLRGQDSALGGHRNRGCSRDVWMLLAARRLWAETIRFESEETHEDGC